MTKPHLSDAAEPEIPLSNESGIDLDHPNESGIDLTLMQDVARDDISQHVLLGDETGLLECEDDSGLDLSTPPDSGIGLNDVVEEILKDDDAALKKPDLRVFEPPADEH